MYELGPRDVISSLKSCPKDRELRIKSRVRTNVHSLSFQVHISYMWLREKLGSTICFFSLFWSKIAIRVPRECANHRDDWIEMSIQWPWARARRKNDNDPVKLLLYFYLLLISHFSIFFRTTIFEDCIILLVDFWTVSAPYIY